MKSGTKLGHYEITDNVGGGPATNIRATATWIVLSLVAMSTLGDLEGQEVEPLVLILAGQSNMVGQGVTSELGDGARLPATVEYFAGSVETQPHAQPEFGPEVTLGQALAEAIPNRRIVLVKYAVNGTSLLNWAPTWDSARAQITPHPTAGPLYSELLTIMDELGLRRGTELGGILWMQGERDARVPEAGEHYFENLSTLIAAFRRDLGVAELPFFLGVVNPPQSTYPATQTVREAQQRAAQELPGVYLVQTDDLTKRDDNLHYDTDGILELGRRFAAAFLAARQ